MAGETALSTADPRATLALQAVRRLQGAGFIAYLAGGCVRDTLLGRPPKDFDIATNALPENILSLFPNAIEVGKAFGVVRAPVGNVVFEIATFRSDLSYSDGRHPDAVKFADAAHDALRRDFTINAMFYDPVAGKLIDYVGGKKDLDDRTIRFVGDDDARIKEDHLRMLRAVRFAAALDFHIASGTFDAIRRNAPLITRISMERVRDEMTRLLIEASKPGQAIMLLNSCGLLEQILPEVAAMKGQDQPPEFHPEGDVFTHTAAMLDLMQDRSEDLAWSVLLHDVGKPQTAERTAEGRLRFPNHAKEGARLTQSIMQRLRFPSRSIETVSSCVANHMRIADARKMRQSTLRRMVGSPHFPLELELHRLDCLASHRKLENYHFLSAFMERMRSEPVLPKPWITGNDIKAMGVPEGPEVGHWRRTAYDAQLEGSFPTRDTLLDWLKEQIAANRPPASPNGPENTIKS